MARGIRDASTFEPDRSTRWHSIGSILLFLIASNAAAVAQGKEAVDVVKVNTDLVVFDV
jgi:hypothetical protein